MATGHIRRIAPINQDRTSSGVSRLMYACHNTFIHRACQELFSCQLYPLVDDVEKESGRWACFEENEKRKWDLPKGRFVPPPAKARFR